MIRFVVAIVTLPYSAIIGILEPQVRKSTRHISMSSIMPHSPTLGIHDTDSTHHATPNATTLHGIGEYIDYNNLRVDNGINLNISSVEHSYIFLVRNDICICMSYS